LGTSGNKALLTTKDTKDKDKGPRDKEQNGKGQLLCQRDIGLLVGALGCAGQ